MALIELEPGYPRRADQPAVAVEGKVKGALHLFHSRRRLKTLDEMGLHVPHVRGGLLLLHGARRLEAGEKGEDCDEAAQKILPNS